jgi:hypothetical protein
VLARLAQAERIKASAREFDVDHHAVIDETREARKRGGSLGHRRDQCGREKDQGGAAQLDFGLFLIKQGKVVAVCPSFKGIRIVPSDGPLFTQNYRDREVFLSRLAIIYLRGSGSGWGMKGSEPGLFRANERE